VCVTGRNQKGNTGGCSAYAAQSVEVEVVGVSGAAPEVAVEADGELLGHLPAKFTILPGALRIIT
jgi:diacylglycerol kinase family enzyme